MFIFLAFLYTFLSNVDFVNEFRSEFKDKVIYQLGARGPTYYDCSTSIAYIFIKHGMIKRKDGSAISVQDFRGGEYNAAYMDHDKVNFSLVPKGRAFKRGDLFLISNNGACDYPTHWVVLSDPQKLGQGWDQWRANTLMEVKGWGASRPYYFDETTDHPKFRDNILCSVVRHHSFEDTSL